MGFAKKSGAWINFDQGLIKDIKEDTNLDVPEKIQGMEQLRNYLENNPLVCTYLFNKFKSILSK